MKEVKPVFPLQPIPRAYTDLTVPLLPDGRRLDFGATGELFDFYIAWLTDHLRETEIPISPEQAPIAAAYKGCSPCSIVFWLSEWLSYTCDFREGIVNHILDGDTFEQIVAFEEFHWRENLTGNPHEDMAYEDFVTSRHAYDRVVQEMDIEAKLADIPAHLDVFFRPLLALAVKRCETRQEAEHILQRFYVNFQDNIGK